MKLKKTLRTLRRTDTETHRQIIEAFPPDWDMEKTFARSLQNYRQQHEQPASEPPMMPTEAEPRRIRLHISRWIATAACLAAAVGVTGLGIYLQRTLSRTPAVQTEPTILSDTADRTAVSTTAPRRTDIPQSTAQTADSTAAQSGSDSAQSSATETSGTTPSVSGTSGSLTASQTAASSGTLSAPQSDRQTAASTTVTTASTASSTRQSSSSQTVHSFTDIPGGVVGGPQTRFVMTYKTNGFSHLSCSGGPQKLRSDLRLKMDLSGYSVEETTPPNVINEKRFQLSGPWSSDPVLLTLFPYGGFSMETNLKTSVAEPQYLGGSEGYVIHPLDPAVRTGYLYVWDAGECVAVLIAGKESLQEQIDRIVLNLIRY